MGDRLGMDCFRGVTARRGNAIKGFIRLTDGCGNTHSRLALGMVPVRVFPRRSRVPGRVQFQMYLAQRLPSAISSQGKKIISLQSS